MDKNIMQCQMCRVTIEMDDQATPFHNVPGIGICCEGCSQDLQADQDMRDYKDLELSPDDVFASLEEEFGNEDYE